MPWAGGSTRLSRAAHGPARQHHFQRLILPRQHSPSFFSVLTPRGSWAGRTRRVAVLRERAISEGTPTRPMERREGLYRRLLAGGDALAALIALQTVVSVTPASLVRPGAAIALLAMVLVNKLSGLYDRDEIVLNRSTLEEVPRLFQISGLYALGAWLLHELVTSAHLTQMAIGWLWLLTFVLLVAGRVSARALARRLSPMERCLVIGDPVMAERIRIKMRDSHVKAEVVGGIAMPDEDHPESLRDTHSFRRLVESFDVQRVIVAPPGGRSGSMLEVIRMAKAAGLNVSLLPRIFEVVGSSVEFDELDGMTVLGIRRFGLSRSSRAVKRTLDLVGAGLGLLAVSPFLAAIALMIRFDSRGPVFFRQTRVGRDGQRFQMIKFRTMVPNAEALKADLHHRNEGAEGFFKIADDPRITRVGRMLRRTSLDELPQLFNVLRGEMSLVGPAAAHRGGGRADPGLRPQPPASDPGHDRPLAGARLRAHPDGGDDEHRLPLRRQLVPVGGHQDPGPHRRARVLARRHVTGRY